MLASAQSSHDPVSGYIAALGGRPWKTRWQAAQALGELQDGRAVDPLVKALVDNNQWVRIVAAEALGQLGDRSAVIALIQALEDESIWVRRACVVALGQIGDEQAVAPLMERLLDPPDSQWPEEVRDAIAKALGAIGGAAIQTMIDALEHADPWVSGAAARALGQIGDPEAILPLTALVKGEQQWVRSAATQALAQIADARAVRAALSVDEAPRAFWKLMALKEIDESTVQQLTALLDDPDEEIRSRAAEVLSQLSDAESGETLAAAFQTQQTPVARESAPSAADVTVEPLVAALEDPVAEVRLAAAEALGKVCDAGASAALSRALADGDSRVRAAAARALGEIGARSAR